MMEVQLKEQTLEKKTLYGKVDRSLKQYVVKIKAEGEKRFRQAGYIGSQPGAKFLPLCGFPDEMSADVCKGIQEQLGLLGHFDKRPDAADAPTMPEIEAAKAPKTQDQLNDIENQKVLEQGEDDE